jgi:hypothetical protein
MRWCVPVGRRLLVQVLQSILLGVVALAGCQGQAPAPGKPPPDPPSGELRPNEPISYRLLAEHLGFNTKTRMGVMMLRGRLLQVYGPV